MDESFQDIRLAERENADDEGEDIGAADAVRTRSKA
jgi:hypothetical protein